MIFSIIDIKRIAASDGMFITTEHAKVVRGLLRAETNATVEDVPSEEYILDCIRTTSWG